MTTVDLAIYVVLVVVVATLILFFVFRRINAAAAERRLRRSWEKQTEDAISNSFDKFVARRLDRIYEAVERYRDAQAAANERKKDAIVVADERNPHMGMVRRVVMPVLAVFWVVVFVLQIVLDIQITHGLYPKNPVIALLLGTAAALIISGLALLWTVLLLHQDPRPADARRESRSSSAKRKWVIGVAGGAILLILVGVVVAYAPNRSKSSNLGQDVTNAEKAEANTEALYRAGGTDQDAVDVSKANLAAARAKLDSAEAIDRAFAVIVPTAEIALSFAAVQAGWLLMWFLALRRIRRLEREAARNKQLAADAERSLIGEIDNWREGVSARLLKYGLPNRFLKDFLQTPEFLRYLNRGPAWANAFPVHTQPELEQPTVVFSRPMPGSMPLDDDAPPPPEPSTYAQTSNGSGVYAPRNATIPGDFRDDDDGIEYNYAG